MFSISSAPSWRVHVIVAALAAACLALSAAPARAQAGGASDSGSVRPVIGASVTGGGDTLVTVQFTDGSSQKIRSGSLLQLFGGIEVDLGSVVAQATIGYHVDDTNASNGSVKFARYPLELLGLWKAGDDWRVGAGLRKALNARVTSSGAARSSIGGTEFDSELGVIVQVERQFGPGLVFGRFVSEKYTVGREKVDANHLGLGVAYRF